MSYYIGQQVVYFPEDGQLSEEFCNDNNLVRKKDDAGNNIGGYLDPGKRNITTIRLRGEVSDGLILPIECLSKYTDISKLNDGDIIDTLNGHEICKKYIPERNNRRGNQTTGNKTRKRSDPIAPLFKEHADTEQLAYNLGTFSEGDEVEITLKLHGTSARLGRLPVLKGYKRTLKDKLLHKKGNPIYDWGYIAGTRRTILDDFEGGFYGNDHFREQSAKFFEGKLWKGETVYMEIVGFIDSGRPIMPSASNKKVNDKTFTKQYGDTTTFSYGCSPRKDSAMQNDFYVYRMTMTNEDGEVVEYPPDFMRYRCEQMGCKSVPVMWRGIINKPDSTTYSEDFDAGEYIKDVAEQFYDGPDPIGKTHIREGVVVRITNKPKFCAYKHKNQYFKILSGIAKNDASEPDMEEAQDELDG